MINPKKTWVVTLTNQVQVKYVMSVEAETMKEAKKKALEWDCIGDVDGPFEDFTIDQKVTGCNLEE